MTNNPQADAMTRATQIAAGAIKSKFRDDGGRLRDWRTTDHATAIVKLSKQPEIIERAVADVAKFKTSARRKAR